MERVREVVRLRTEETWFVFEREEMARDGVRSPRSGDARYEMRSSLCAVAPTDCQKRSVRIRQPVAARTQSKDNGRSARGTPSAEVQGSSGPARRVMISCSMAFMSPPTIS